VILTLIQISIDLNEEIKAKTKQYYNLKIPDAIMELFYFPLVTADKDFKRIKDIDLIFYLTSC
jgi:hypothetical protein